MPGFVGDVAGAVIGGNAAKDAASTQAAAADRATDAQLEMYEQTREDLAPYRASGTAANTRLAYLMGLEDVAFDRDAIEQKIRDQYAGALGTNKKEPEMKENPYIAESPYVLPVSYMNTFVPGKIHSQFLKPTKVENEEEEMK